MKAIITGLLISTSIEQEILFKPINGRITHDIPVLIENTTLGFKKGGKKQKRRF